MASNIQLNENIMMYFKNLSSVPRSSSNEKEIQNFLIEFAKEHNLPYYADEYNNVIIYKKTCLKKPPIILHAHTDMVCVKTQNSLHDFSKDGIEIIRKGEWLTAKDTSLGADNGIGIAIILDILDTIDDCNIEALFTASEETTMQGTYKINTKKLSAKQMISLDGIQADAILTSSASFTDFLVKFNNNKVFVSNDKSLKTFKLTLSGLEGGHSGFDIDKNKGNSNKLVTKLLSNFQNVIINDFCGGYNYNTIPNKTEVVFTTAEEDKNIKKMIKSFYNENKKQYKTLKIECNRQLNKTLVLEQSENLLSFINNFSQGVLKRDEFNNITVSQNLSEVNTETGEIKIGVRSNIKGYEKEIIDELKRLCEKYNFVGKNLDSQPSFNSLPQSQLFEKLKEINPNSYEIKSHITVECGILQNRIKNLDVVVIAPTILNAHSVLEKVNIESISSTSNWLKKYLQTY